MDNALSEFINNKVVVILALLTVPILFYSINADISMKEPPNWQASPKLINLIPFAVNLFYLLRFGRR